MEMWERWRFHETGGPELRRLRPTPNGAGRVSVLTADMILRSSGVGLLLILLGTTSCTSLPKETTAANRRVKDSPAEKAAAHRAAAPRSLELGKEDERWMFEEARARKRAREREGAARPRPGAGVGTTDVVEASRSP